MRALEHEGVGAVAAVQSVAPCPAHHLIVAGVAVQHVTAAPAPQRIGAILPFQPVAAGAAQQMVVPCAVAAIQRVVAVAARQAVVAGAAIQYVVAFAAVQRVVACAARQRVVDVTALKQPGDVVASGRLQRSADDGVRHVRAFDANLAAAVNVDDRQIAVFAHGVPDVGREMNRIAGSRIERMHHVHVTGRHVRKLELEGVGAGAAVQSVAAGAAHQFIVAVVAAQGVGAIASPQLVVVGPPSQPVVAGAAQQMVVACAAVQRVVACATRQTVVACAAVQRVVADAAFQRVVIDAAFQNCPHAVASARPQRSADDGARHVRAFNVDLAAVGNVDDRQIAVFAQDVPDVVRETDRIAGGRVERMHHVHVAARHVRALEHEGVGAGAAMQSVAPCPAHQRIVAAVAAQGVGAAPAPQRIGVGLPSQPVVAGAACQMIAAVAAVQPVVAGAAFGLVVAPAAPQRVVAGLAANEIVPARARDEVGCIRSRQRVVGVRSVQVRHFRLKFPLGLRRAAWRGRVSWCNAACVRRRGPMRAVRRRGGCDGDGAGNGVRACAGGECATTPNNVILIRFAPVFSSFLHFLWPTCS